jgi:hypothetical protein
MRTYSVRLEPMNEISFSPYAFMVWYLIMNGDSLPFNMIYALNV